MVESVLPKIDYGNPDPIGAYQQAQAGDIANQTKGLALAQQKLAAVGDLLYDVTPENYATRRQIGINSGIFTSKQVPENYDLGFVRNMQSTHTQAMLQLADQATKTDTASKANIYATQVLSAATANGDQNMYDRAKTQLQASGIDVSGWAPDVMSASKQAQAARLAQSPLGSLLNAGTKIDANNLTYGGQAGQLIPPTLGGLFGGGAASLAGINPAPGGAVPAPAPASVPAAPAPNMQPQTAPNQGTQPPAPGGAQNLNYTIPTRNPIETQAAYEARPDVMAAKKLAETSAGKTGDAIGDAAKTLNIMQSNLPMVLERFQGMRDAAKDAGYGYGNNNEGTGFAQEFYNNFNSSKTAKANATLQQKAAQGILPELGPQLAQAGIKGNKFLETLGTQASGLDLAAPPAAKQKVIDGLETTYINNLKSTAAQLRNNGQNAPTDKEIDDAVAQLKSPPQEKISVSQEPITAAHPSYTGQPNTTAPISKAEAIQRLRAKGYQL